MALDGHLDIAVTDDAVEFSVTVQNASTEPVDLEFRSAKRVDVSVYDDETDERVWNSIDETVFAQVLATETVAPGEKLIHGATWDDPVPGSYIAVASLEATNVDFVVRAGFEV